MDSKKADEQLQLIRQAQESVHKINRRGGGGILIVWGLVWLTGFGVAQLLPATWRIWSWLLAGGIGAVVSTLIGVRLETQIRYPQTGPLLGRFYAGLLFFALLWLFLARPESGAQIAVLLLTFIAFSLFVSGLLFDAASLAVGGLILGVTAVALFLLLPAHFIMLVVMFGGSGMLLSGTILLVKGSRDG